MKVQDGAPLDSLLSAIATEGRWVDELFTGFQLYPYFDSSERTTKTLTTRSLASKIIGVLARGASITDLLNELSKQWTDVNVFGGATAGQPGLIEALHKTLDNHTEGKKTVIDRIEKIRLRQEAAQLAFNGVQYSHSPVRAETKNVSYLRPLLERIDNVDEQFTSVRGMLCNVDAARQAGTYVGKMLEESGVRWVLTDFPGSFFRTSCSRMVSWSFRSPKRYWIGWRRPCRSTPALAGTHTYASMGSAGDRFRRDTHSQHWRAPGWSIGCRSPRASYRIS